MKQNYVPHYCVVNNCAVYGATSFFCGFANSVVIINGSKFCFMQMLHSIEKSFNGSLKKRVFCTDITEKDIVFGTEDKLLKLLSVIRNTQTPDIIFIQNNCAVSLIGDDIKEIAASMEFTCPVVCLDSGGIQGDFYSGYSIAAKSFFKTLQPKEGSLTNNRHINILGVTESYYNFLNDKKELVRLLNIGNIKVLNYISHDMSMKGLADMKMASLNVVIHQELGEGLAKFLYREYGIPYIVLLPPYGLVGSEKWVVEIMLALGCSESEVSKVKNIFEKHSQSLVPMLQKVTKIYGELWIDRVIVTGPYSTVMGMATALRTEFLNYHYMDLYIYSDFDKSFINENYYSFHTEFTSADIAKHIDDNEGCFVFSSANEHSLLLIKKDTTQLGYCCINYPGYDYISLGAYMGISGAKKILEYIWQYYIRQNSK